MASPMKNLLSELDRYTQSFRLFLERSTEHQSMQEFVEKQLPDIVASIGNGKSTINVLSVGSGAGEMDLQILSKIRARYPGVTINNDVIEPSASQISKYKEHVAQASNLENIKFTWHKETANEYESRMNAEKKTKKWDFIHMIQMLYYVKDIPATLRYFHSLLEPQAKLLIILVSGKSGWETLWRKYSSSFPLEGFCSFISSADLPRMLDSTGMKYQLYELPSHLDITSCFIEGDKDGELLLDFLTETIDFTKTAPPELKRQVLEELRKPGCSEIRDGKVFFNSSLGIIVVEP
ncbi:histamine N-methyltransferase-like [Acridotheres tristis]